MRRADWEARLVEVIRAGDREWQWGVHDCATFANNCARAVLDGPTPWDKHFKPYETEKEAVRLLKRRGGLVKMLDGGADRINVNMAQRGDLGVVRGNGQDPDPEGELAVGVIDGRHIVFAAIGGVARWPISYCEICWAVR